MKILLRITTLLVLVGVTTMANAALPAGEWTVKPFADSVLTAQASFKVCLESNGNFHANVNPLWNGKWFNKGNDLHLISIHSTGAFGFSLELSKVNNNSYAGYYQWISYSAPGIPDKSEFDTASMTFIGSLCHF